jgi:flavin-dependent dehydrogenase
MGPGGPGRRLRDMFGARNRPMISVDTKVLSDLQTVKARIAELTTQMKTLANEAERYARAMSGVAGTSMGQFKTGSRPANFPQVMRPGEAAAPRLGTGNHQAAVEAAAAVEVAVEAPGIRVSVQSSWRWCCRKSLA